MGGGGSQHDEAVLLRGLKLHGEIRKSVQIFTISLSFR